MKEFATFLYQRAWCCLLLFFLAACSGQVEKVSKIHSIDTVCSRHDETGGVVVILQLEQKPELLACNFTLWNSKSVGRIMSGVKLTKLKPYRHELYPDFNYYACDFSS